MFCQVVLELAVVAAFVVFMSIGAVAIAEGLDEND
jgi:hypothetical protein